MNYVILFDLDGTLDAAHRLPLLRESDHPDWDKFFDACDRDEPIAAGATVYNLLATQCHQLGHLIQEGKIEADIPFVDIMTGRPERLRAKTETWLLANGFLMPRSLHMRADDDRRPDNVIKIEMFERHYAGKENVLAVFEDRDRVVQAWRKRGVPCFQVAEGRY